MASGDDNCTDHTNCTLQSEHHSHVEISVFLWPVLHRGGIMSTRCLWFIYFTRYECYTGIFQDSVIRDHAWTGLGYIITGLSWYNAIFSIIVSYPHYLTNSVKETVNCPCSLVCQALSILCSCFTKLYKKCESVMETLVQSRADLACYRHHILYTRYL